MKANGPTETARNGQKLIVGPWLHGAQVTATAGHTLFGGAAQVLLEELHMRWFDHWLKDIDNGLDREAPVRVFAMGENQWREYSAWPPPEATLTPYYLHSNGAAATARGDGSLSTDAPGSERSDHFVYDPLNPCPTRGGSLFPMPLDVPPGQFDQSKIEERPDVLCYTSAPLDRPMEVTGPVEVRLWAASTARDTDFTAKLVDVQPDGTALNLCDGILRARYRDSFETATMLDPGQPVELTIDLSGTCNVFLPGHRIRLEVSSSNFPRFDRNTNTGDNIATDAGHVVATNTVLHDSSHPSRVILPVVPRS
jgi:putative CocE/NonD family hydrolase